ncbi:MAG: cell division ATP-binding protein FtsE [Anderseniella sp.]|nr:cell division ATP-binding protein FtsE [Anderseniella sp.]
MVRFENVGLRYGTGPEVLRDLNLTLETGSFSFLTGASGAGKTSLMRMLFLALKPTRGMISLFGENIGALPRSRLPDMRRRIGVVFQEFRLLDHLTTFENVALPLRIRGGKLADYQDNVMELLDWVGLDHHANSYPPVLSGGEKQRAAIARAVISSPELLLADEPTGNVDPALALRLMKLFRQLNQFGTTVLIATHDTHLLETFDVPVLKLKDGRTEWQT